MSFLVGVCIEVRCRELTELVEHCLGSKIIADGDTNTISFKKGAEAREVAGSGESRKGNRMVDRLECGAGMNDWLASCGWWVGMDQTQL